MRNGSSEDENNCTKGIFARIRNYLSRCVLTNLNDNDDDNDKWPHADAVNDEATAATNGAVDTTRQVKASKSRSLERNRRTTKQRRATAENGAMLPYATSLLNKDKPAYVCPGLYVGSQISAGNFMSLGALGITHVINLATGVSNCFPDDFQYLRLQIFDSPEANLLSVLPTAVSFIENALKDNSNNNDDDEAAADNGDLLATSHQSTNDDKNDSVTRKENTVFVHCNAGVSRSVSVVIAYLLSKYHSMTVRQALEQVRKTRPFAQPNEGFMKQLETYRRQLHSKAKHSDEADNV